MRYLLSIHDVWPGNFPAAEGHLRKLKSLGAGRVALLVVPEYHGLRPMGAEAEFLAWLREKSDAGSEILLHGCRHLMGERLPGAIQPGGAGQAGASRRNAWGRWVNRHLVSGEAEFCGLPASDRAALLERGAGALRDAGFPSRGFVAPTWHGAPTLRALAAQGFTLWESRFFLRHLPTGRARFAPPLAFGPPGPEARLAGGPLWLEALLRLPLIKVALHPGDLDGDAPAGALERVFARGRETAYADVFASPAPGAAALAASR